MADDPRSTGTLHAETQPTTSQQAQFIFDQWDKRARERDVPRLLDLYTNDAVLESPLVPRILDQPGGVVRGTTELERFFTEGGRRRPDELVRWRRDGTYLWDGRILFWEYQRATPDGDQIDIAEVMELANGLIAAHRIYWGWFGTERLITNALQRASAR